MVDNWDRDLTALGKNVRFEWGLRGQSPSTSGNLPTGAKLTIDLTPASATETTQNYTLRIFHLTADNNILFDNLTIIYVNGTWHYDQDTPYVDECFLCAVAKASVI